jgi:hypothetical protein
LAPVGVIGFGVTVGGPSRPVSRMTGGGGCSTSCCGCAAEAGVTIGLERKRGESSFIFPWTGVDCVDLVAESGSDLLPSFLPSCSSAAGPLASDFRFFGGSMVELTFASNARESPSFSFFGSVPSVGVSGSSSSASCGLSLAAGVCSSSSRDDEELGTIVRSAGRECGVRYGGGTGAGGYMDSGRSLL